MVIIGSYDEHDGCERGGSRKYLLGGAEALLFSLHLPLTWLLVA